ncbi:membrane fusion protein, Cu(I)/Ag(I) efflux system [Cupriavidus sp. YR651]|uniref:efflux RND transporter periplasmic adaptor subunit n=1 Tax=Cupriavidus sp. YR651 TaxID=1855315 RepID=UPI000886D3A7|nr:efflux RND transporter periplasmic adaptor subunit [Cupriavidus sp. YR651]SDC87204.1 membrane fusion protein, Cu(I)/Ag(I) efflux system [Cupriavidus sp. YR651]
MKRQAISIAVALAVAGGALYGTYRLGVTQGAKSASSPVPAMTGDSAKAGGSDPNTGKRVLYWHDPMVPGQRFDKPGKSPFMDMQLVPVYEDAGGTAAAVTIDSRVTQNLGIRTVEVKPGRLDAVLEVPGNVAINERGIEVIQARTSGYVEHAYARTTLDPVKRGQALVVIYSPEWVAAQEEYLAVARVNSGPLGDLRSAASARMRQVGMTESQIRLVETTGKLQPRLTISASVDGVVTEVGARDGMTVAPGMTLFRIADLSTVWVLAEVPESQSAAIKPGQQVTAIAAGLAGQTLTGKVDAVLPDVSPGTRTLKVRIALQNKDRQLLPGMFVSVRFSAPAGADKLLVPTEALIRTGARTIAMVETGDGGFSPVEVKTGAEAAGQTEVTEGLKAGQRVVTSGQFLVDSEASLRGTTRRLESASAPASTPASASAPAAAAAPEHEALGRIEAVGAESLTISHGAIPSLQWGAMTMDFKAPPSGLPRGLKDGQQIRFHFHLNNDGEPVLSSVQPVAGNAGGKP